MSRNIFLTDLDDTLFTSARKGTSPEGAPVTTAKNGNHSYMSGPQKALLKLMRDGEVIPVTARSSDAFSRVHLDFGTRRAILANGAVLLNEEGEPDPEWRDHTGRIGRLASGAMRGMIALIEEEFGEAMRTWIVEEYGSPIYFCLKSNSKDPSEIERGLSEAGMLLFDRFDLSGFQHHVNGNNLSLTPIGISKEEAVLRLISQLGNRSEFTLFGAGDSLTDLPFMRHCDILFTPKGSQIVQAALRNVEHAEDLDV